MASADREFLRFPRRVAALLLLGLICGANSRAQTVEYIHTDALGTPVAVTDAAQNVIERSEYSPYGDLLNRADKDGPGYTGHVQDAATGLSYMQQRYYDPAVGRFLSVDPVVALDGGQQHFNRYDYAYNNPYRFTDPDGRCPSCDRFSDAYAANPGAFEAFEPFAIQVTATALAVTPVVGPILTLSFRAAVREAASTGGRRTYTTYTRAKEDGTVYSGRTSGKSTPEQQVAARTSRPDHKARTAEGYGPAKVDKNSPNANAIRGREQQLIEQNGGAQSQGGTSGNKINGVSPKNPRGETYRAACESEFGC